MLAPMFAYWVARIQYLHQHYLGLSLHAGETLCDWAEVDVEGFSDLSLSISPTILLEGIGTLEEHHGNMAAIFKAEPLAAFFRFSQHGTQLLACSWHIQGLTSGVSATDLQALIQHLHAPLRRNEEEQRKIWVLKLGTNFIWMHR